MDNIPIRCPKCHWEPDGKPYWQCTCGTNWDTFSTGARCPGCGKVWEYTQCIGEAGGCSKWSPHLDWYEGLDDVVNKLKEEIKESWTVPQMHHTLSGRGIQHRFKSFPVSTKAQRKVMRHRACPKH